MQEDLPNIRSLYARLLEELRAFARRTEQRVAEVRNKFPTDASPPAQEGDAPEGDRGSESEAA